jgi:hypothetical protein
MVLVELASRKKRGDLPSGTSAISPDARLRVSQEDGNTTDGVLLHRANHDLPLVRLGKDTTSSTGIRSQFRGDRYFAWGNDDGSVFVCDIEEVGRRLNAFGLPGW